MPIELSCPQCQATLRVPDEAAGEQAQCPHCESVFDVGVPLEIAAAGQIVDDVVVSSEPSTAPAPPRADPFAETVAPDASGMRPPPHVDQVDNPYADSPHVDSPYGDNPYAAPRSEPDTWSTRLSEIQLGQLAAGTAVQISWELFTANLPALMVANGVALFLIVGSAVVAESTTDMGNPALTLIAHICSYCVQWFLGIGLTALNLRVARGQPADVGMIFSGGACFLRVAIATLIYSVVVTLGMILFIVPGIYLASRLWAYQCFIVDRDCGVMESLNLSAEFMEGNKMQAVVMMFYVVLIAIAGALAFCVGIFFAIPVITMLWVVAYLMITRQAIQRPVR